MSLIVLILARQTLTVCSCLLTLGEILFNEIPVETLANPKMPARDANNTTETKLECRRTDFH